jgi:hypothetical protein
LTLVIGLTTEAEAGAVRAGEGAQPKGLFHALHLSGRLNGSQQKKAAKPIQRRMVSPGGARIAAVLLNRTGDYYRG